MLSSQPRTEFNWWIFREYFWLWQQYISCKQECESIVFLGMCKLQQGGCCRLELHFHCHSLVRSYKGFYKKNEATGPFQYSDFTPEGALFHQGCESCGNNEFSSAVLRLAVTSCHRFTLVGTKHKYKVIFITSGLCNFSVAGTLDQEQSEVEKVTFNWHFNIVWGLTDPNACVKIVTITAKITTISRLIEQLFW